MRHGSVPLNDLVLGCPFECSLRERAGRVAQRVMKGLGFKGRIHGGFWDLIPYPRALRAHALRSMGPETILCINNEVFVTSWVGFLSSGFDLEFRVARAFDGFGHRRS